MFQKLFNLSKLDVAYFLIFTGSLVFMYFAMVTSG
ncbi:hypothetical protein N783_04545 [Pontibacillus marinus BH030004 = DSM 16465]|uniref:Uncharacterized protein n=1 Tax=Pontibacillus marinus BH030004 = DSM 16465 TaxID=1385511 RepID=A0A0A5FX50_9BACI|nr:hypothetical protein N783_04545 [Pontibacillus marinus BH030004 = DSM 16465]